MRWLSLLLLCFLTLLWCTPASAQQAPRDPAEAREEALTLFRRAGEHFEAGQYDRSKLLLQEAISLYDAPPLHYNLARTHDELGELEEARREYRSFLDGVEDAPNRAEVEARIEAIDEMLVRQAEERALAEVAAREAAEREAARQAEAQTSPIEEAPSRSAGPWITLGSAAAPLAGAVAMSVLFQREVDDARNAPDQVTADDHRSRADGLGLGANILYGVAGAVAAAGLIWLVVDLTRSADSDAEDEGGTSAQIHVGPSSVALSGTF